MDSNLTRRTLFAQSLAGGAALLASPFSLAEGAAGTRKFTIDLTPGAIGVVADPESVIELAAKHGFESVQPNGSYLGGLDTSERKEMAAKLKEKGLVWGAAGLAVDFRGEDDVFQEGMKVLPKTAQAMHEAGVTRVGTWIKPYHEAFTYRRNFEYHVRRLGMITKVLGDHGLRFGLEYVGTKTLWTSQRYSFIHTMMETKELIAEIDQPTLGFVLDSWHWFTAGETAEDIATLCNGDVVACDLNDAPTGIPIEEQLDGQRELPAATGVIDIKAFLSAVVAIGYDGPVRAEPFNQPLRELDDEAAAAATVGAIRKAMEMAGI